MTADKQGREICLRPERSFIVTAPAGSGKTELLTARYLSLLSKGGFQGAPCQPNQILAVTFTDKAALEMKARIALWLERAKDPGYQAEDGSAWDKIMLGKARDAWSAHGDNEVLLMNPTAYRVQTFHSFCSSICRAWPVESGIPVSAEILPDHRQDGVLEEAVQSLMRDLKGRPGGDPLAEAAERRLAALGNRTRTFVGHLVSVLKERLRLDALGSLCTDGAAEAAGALEDYFESLVEPARSFFGRHRAEWDKVRELNRENPVEEGADLPHDIPEGGLKSFGEWKRVSTVFLTKSQCTPRKLRGKWSDVSAFFQDFPEECVGALKFFRNLDVGPEGLKLDEGALSDYWELAKAAQAHLDPLIPGEGLDYAQLEIGAERALRNPGAEGLPSESLIFCHDHLRHILVDEAQDMNRFQLGLLGLLTDSWEAIEPSDPRTVFVVGDPKQSIYRFRGAEVALFDEIVREGIARPGEEPFTFGGPVELTANFRSSPGLVGFANGLFKGVFGSPDPKSPCDEVAFGNGEAARKSEPYVPEIRLAVFPKVTKSEGKKPEGKQSEIKESEAKEPKEKSPAGEREAKWVAAEVARLYRDLTSDPEKSSETIGILLPRRTNLDAYVAELRAAEVPVRMVEGENLGAKPEVVHLHNLFKALSRPYDDVAWAGVLRAPWTRLGEKTLHALSQGDKTRGNWRERILLSELPEVRAFCAKLAPALADFGRGPYDASLQSAWEGLGGPEAIASYYGTAGVGNSMEYLELVGECGGMPAEEAVRLVEERLEKSYTPPDPAAATSPVHLMTIHKAKGLEFDHVFAVHLGYRPKGGGGRNQLKPPFLMLDLPGRRGRRVPCATVEADSRVAGKSLPHCLLSELDKGRELAEVKRLFYVAVTRAKRSLTLSGQIRSLAKDPCWEADTGSPMSLLLDAVCEGATVRPEFKQTIEPLVDPEPETLKDVERDDTGPAQTPAEPLQAFRLPYVTKSPSDKVDPEEDQAKTGGEDEVQAEDDPSAAPIGNIVHRLLEKMAREGDRARRPEPDGVAAALRSEGLTPAEAKRIAPQLIEEAGAAWADPGFAALRRDGALKPEWGLEHLIIEKVDDTNVLMTGRLDLVIVKEREVIVLDYKTGRRKEKGTAQFTEEMTAHYGPQLRHYKAMLSALPDFAGKSVRCFLLLTDLPEGRVVDVG